MSQSVRTLNSLLKLTDRGVVLSVLTLGCLNLWPIAVGLGMWLVVKRRFPFSWFQVFWLVLGSVGFAISGESRTLMWSCIVVMVISLVEIYRKGEFDKEDWYWPTLILMAHAGAMMWQLDGGNLRPHGLNRNAIPAGLTGMAFLLTPMWIVAVAVTALSGTRSIALAIVFFAVFKWRKSVWLAVGVGAVVWLLVAYQYNPQRIGLSESDGALHFNTSNVERDIDLRVDTLNDGVALASECGEFREIELTWHGYGVGGFCKSTGRQGPHNAFVMSAYMWGILTVPFWLGICWYFRRRLTFILPALVVFSMFNADLVMRPESVFVLGVFAVNYMRYFGTRDMRVTGVEY